MNFLAIHHSSPIQSEQLKKLYIAGNDLTSLELAVKELSKKICLLGTFAVGKTSLVQRFTYNRFDERYISTLGGQR